MEGENTTISNNDNKQSELKFPDYLEDNKTNFIISQNDPSNIEFKTIREKLPELADQFAEMQFSSSDKSYYESLWNTIVRKNKCSKDLLLSPKNFLVELQKVFLAANSNEKLPFKDFIRNSRFRVGRISDLIKELESSIKQATDSDHVQELKKSIEQANHSYATTVVVDKKTGKPILKKKSKQQFVQQFVRQFPLSKKREDIGEAQDKAQYIEVYLHPLYNEISHPMLIAYEVFRYLLSPKPVVSFDKVAPPYADAFYCAFSVCNF